MHIKLESIQLTEDAPGAEYLLKENIKKA